MTTEEGRLRLYGQLLNAVKEKCPRCAAGETLHVLGEKSRRGMKLATFHEVGGRFEDCPANHLHNTIRGMEPPTKD
jgi:hypothetical protein